jgi:uncharacterized membrane protein YfcA
MVFVINGVAVVAFIVARAVYWKHGIVTIGGGLLGGYLGAHYAQKLPLGPGFASLSCWLERV